MAYTILITGATGMVGKGILLECLESDQISAVVLINRSPIDISHPKIHEVILKDFSLVATVKDKILRPDGCFHCMGVSSIGLKEEEYNYLTFELTKRLTDLCYEVNPNMVFNYVSGTGTVSSEKGSSMWACIKGKTENYIIHKGFKKAYMFRPGIILPEKGIKSKTGWYQVIYNITRPIFPLLKKSKNITSTTKMGIAMINTLSVNFQKIHLENNDINVLANQ